MMSTDQNNDQSQMLNVESENATDSQPLVNCAICQDVIEKRNRSFVDLCLHQYCFDCLKQWCEVKTECPLCKQKIEKIIHDVKSPQSYKEFIPPRVSASRTVAVSIRATQTHTLSHSSNTQQQGPLLNSIQHIPQLLNSFQYMPIRIESTQPSSFTRARRGATLITGVARNANTGNSESYSSPSESSVIVISSESEDERNENNDSFESLLNFSDINISERTSHRPPSPNRM